MAGSIGRFAFGLGFVLTVIAVWVGVAALSSSGDREDNRNQRYMLFLFQLPLIMSAELYVASLLSLLE